MLQSTVAAFKIVLLEHGYPSTATERSLIESAGGRFVDCEQMDIEVALQEAEDADGVIFRRLDMTADRIARFKKARIILRYGIGTDNVDLEACTRHGIIAGHVPGYCIDDVTTHAIALLMNGVRNIVGNHRAMEHGAWDLQRVTPLYRTEGKVLGLISLGNIGQGMVRKLSGWNMKFLAYDPYVDPQKARDLKVELTDLDTLCAQSDYISVHAPLLPETRHLLGAQEYARMKETAILVNTSRGPVLDTKALMAALDAGQLARAGLDVFETEPLPIDDPIRHHPRIAVSDHTAWYTEESQAILQQRAAEEIVRVCTGHRPQSLANIDLALNEGWLESDWPVPDHIGWQLRRRKQFKR
ncbi:MAG: D-3-phosphoglycerate dehydrogenase [Candidatus Omnitrophota bacterium]